MVPMMLPISLCRNEGFGKKGRVSKQGMKTLIKKGKERILDCKISKMNLILSIAINKKINW